MKLSALMLFALCFSSLLQGIQWCFVIDNTKPSSHHHLVHLRFLFPKLDYFATCRSLVIQAASNAFSQSLAPPNPIAEGTFQIYLVLLSRNFLGFRQFLSLVPIQSLALDYLIALFFRVKHKRLFYFIQH